MLKKALRFFPVANANRRALVEGAAEGELPEIPLKEVPFPPEDSDDKPPPREPKARSVYITVERIIKFKETPVCKACYGKAVIHTPECRKRFTELVEKERKEKEERRSLPPTPRPVRTTNSRRNCAANACCRKSGSAHSCRCAGSARQGGS